MSIWTDTALVLRPEFVAALTDTITTARTTTAGALNTATGVIAAPIESAPYSASAALIRLGDKTGTLSTHDIKQFGEEAAHRDDYTVFVPFDTDIQTDDRVTIDACALDADLVGDEMIVRSVSQDSLNAAKVAICELVV